MQSNCWGVGAQADRAEVSPPTNFHPADVRHVAAKSVSISIYGSTQSVDFQPGPAPLLTLNAGGNCSTGTSPTQTSPAASPTLELACSLRFYRWNSAGIFLYAGGKLGPIGKALLVGAMACSFAFLVPIAVPTKELQL